jgi:hypothetical protein
MTSTKSGNRVYASLLALGACILLYRTIMMISGGYLSTLVFIVAALLVLEFLLDLGWLVGSVRWWIRNDSKRPGSTLRLAAAAIILHAIRVYIFILGRTGPWYEFDVRPEFRTGPPETLQGTWIYFAGIMATLGVIGVIVVGYLIRNADRKNT